MENSQLKQLALLDLSILNFSIMRRRPERGMPGQGLIIAPGALAHFCAAITRSNSPRTRKSPLAASETPSAFPSEPPNGQELHSATSVL